MHYQLFTCGRIPSLVIFLGLNSTLWAGQTVALFQSGSLTTGPFPSDVLTVSDTSQKTGLRVNLRSSGDSCDPSLSPAVCSNSALLNQLDGFSVNPRLMVCFSAAIDPTTLAQGLSIIPLNPSGQNGVVGIDQIIFDPVSNCAFAKPNRVLQQDTRYLFLVTDSVHDTDGNNVTEDDAFRECLNSSDPYCQDIAKVLNQVGRPPASTNNAVTASLFTTMSATAWLEDARQFVDGNEPPIILPAGFPTIFNLAQLQSINWLPAQSGLPPQNIPLSALSGVGEIAFGLYLSPNFIDPATGTIPVTPTNGSIGGPIPVPGVPPGLPSGFVPVSFHIFLPASAPPPGGFPVAIYGHGLGDNQFGAPTYIASTLAQNGFATLAIEITGHGYGAGSTVELTDSQGVVHTVATPGRGILLPGNTVIGPTDGCIIPGAVAVRDCGRQTAVDLVALVDTIRQTQGLGVVDPNKIYYVGQSFGSTYGTLFEAVDTQTHAAIFNGDGGTSVDVARLSISGRPLAIQYLSSLNPALLNVALGVAPPEAYFRNTPGEGAFNDNYVFPGTGPVVNNVAEAIAIQAAFEAADWLDMLGDPLSYAPHLKTSPLAGVPPKSMLFQFGYGDLEVPNPTESAVVRAANAQPDAWFFRFDKATLEYHQTELLGVMMLGVPFPILPHRILSNPTIFDVPAETSLALAEQQQVASFFESDGTTNPNPNPFVTAPFTPGEDLFQVPTVLPEQLNFLQIAP